LRRRESEGGAEKFSALPREARQSKFAVRIFVKKSSDFVQKVPQIDTSSFERVAPRGREAAALRKNHRRFAAKMKGAEKEKRVDLSRT
jgi:hypothetical protein